MMTGKHILITGGAGFIGTNVVAYFLKQRNSVTIFDNMSRPGCERNLKWLREQNFPGLTIIKGDIREFSPELVDAVQQSNFVLHLAGQVAVTTSVTNPREDFEINALGTLNVLEALRSCKKNNAPILIYSSTNKVYGNLESLKVVETDSKYTFVNLPYGVSEQQPLDFHSPYGCSKGSADQYVRDYSRIYDLKTIVFRQSCIYGPHQFGMEDQGWLAWFMICALKKARITIYGNGKQVRDVLFVEDLVRAYELAAENIGKTQGQVYNIGGGTKNSVSIWKDCFSIIEKLFHAKLKAKTSDERPGDQQIFIADTRKALRDFGWKPTTSIQQGTKRLYNWLLENKEYFLS